MIVLLRKINIFMSCAKENILLSELRTTVDLSNRTSMSTPRPTPSPREEQLDEELPDDMKSFMDYHTLDEIISLKQIIHKRMTFYKQMLEAMFMQGAGRRTRSLFRFNPFI